MILWLETHATQAKGSAIPRFKPFDGGALPMEPKKVTYTNSDRVINFIKGAARNKLPSDEKFGYTDAIDLLEALFRIERENAAIDVRLRINDGAMIVYQGIARALLFQTQRHVRLALWRRGDDFEINIRFF